MSANLAGISIALLAALAFSSGSVISRLALARGIPPLASTALSLLAGWVVITLIAAPSLGRELPSISASGWAWLALTAAINFPIGRTLFFQSMVRIGVARANTILAAHPWVSAAIAVAWLGERATPLTVMGLTSIVVGAGIVVRAVPDPLTRGASAAGDGPDRSVAAGYGMALAAMVAYGVVSVLIKKVVGDVTTPAVGAALTFGMGAASLLVITAVRAPRTFRAIPLRAGLLLAAGGTSMSLGVALLYAALARASVVVVVPIVAINPLIAISLATLLAPKRLEQVNRGVWLGAALVVAGVSVLAL